MKTWLAGIALGLIPAFGFAAQSVKAPLTVTAQTASGTLSGGFGLYMLQTSDYAFLKQDPFGANDDIRWSSLVPGKITPEGWGSFRLADRCFVVYNAWSGASALRIYTDNTHASASPRYTGAISSFTPSGLIATTHSSTTVRMAWKASEYVSSAYISPSQPGQNITPKPPTEVTPVTVVPLNSNCDGSETDPDCLKLGNAYDWFLVKDKANLDSYESLKARGYSENSTEVRNAFHYSAISSDQGIHGAQGADGYFPSLAAPKHTMLFLAVDQSQLKAGKTYKTSRLTAELLIP